MTRTLALVLASLIPLTALAADPDVSDLAQPDLAQPDLAQSDPVQSDPVQPSSDEIFRPAGDLELSSFLWTDRLIVVFANTDADPRFQQQIDLLKKEEPLLVDRDVLVLTDTDPDAQSPIRLELRPRGFQMLLIDKDGGVKLRKPFPSTVREITRSIDRTPMRQREVEERRKERHGAP